jgi:hypothetical protein
MPRKETQKTITVLDEEDIPVKVTNAGLPGVVHPGDWDIEDELRGLDTFIEYVREHVRDTNIEFIS